MMNKMSTYFLILLWGILPATQGVSAREAEPTEYRIKAAFIYNFAKFIEWPTDTGTLNLCIFGEDNFGADIDELEGKTVAGKALSVRRIKSLEDLKKCQMVFISSSSSEQLDSVLEGAKGLSLLTVGDTDGYAKHGVIINFYKEQNKVRFEINEEAAGRSGLKLSSKLLGLARIVHGTRQRKGD